MTGFLRRVDTWWFGSESPATLALLRILLGTMAFLSLGLTLFLFQDFYTPDGYAPNAMVDGWLSYQSNVVFSGTALQFHLPFAIPRLTLLGGEPGPGWTLAVYLATMAASVLFALGKWTRISGIVLAVGVISIHTRNPLIIHAGDTLLRICLVYLALSPCGAMYSLDAKSKLGPTLVRVTSRRLVQMQIAVVYLFTAWWKLFGTFWMDGTATWYPAKMHEFVRFPVPEFFERQPFLGLETYGTLLVEIALGTLVFWKPARKWVLLSGVLMHAYIEYRFNIPMFAFIIVACYVAFYDGAEVEAWIERRRARAVEPQTGASTESASS